MHTQSIVPPSIDYGKISADKYDPNSTYKKGELRIQYNTLWKAKQDINIAEPWTESHWESTTLAAEFNLLNSSLVINREVSLSGISINAGATQYRWITNPDVPGYTVIGFYVMSGDIGIVPFFNDTGIGGNGVTVALYNRTTSQQTTGENAKLQFVLMKSGPVSFS